MREGLKLDKGERIDILSTVSKDKSTIKFSLEYSKSCQFGSIQHQPMPEPDLNWAAAWGKVLEHEKVKLQQPRLRSPCSTGFGPAALLTSNDPLFSSPLSRSCRYANSPFQLIFTENEQSRNQRPGATA